MVAVADVIKKMRADGLSREQIIASLEELGFPNAEALYDKNAGTPAPASSTPKPAPKPSGLAEAAERERKEEGSGEEKEESLFGAEELKEKETENDEKESRGDREPPELKITQVGDDGLEKTVSIEEMLSKSSTASASGGIAAAAAGDASLRGKLEETNALLRALAEVNKKILETDREVLMRLKAKEASKEAKPV
jgi:hypothetical protein